MGTLYFIHGFATGPSIWQKQVDVFSKDYRVILEQEQIGLDDELYIIGWSMGGWRAIDLLFESRQKVAGLILVSAFAKYVKGDGYPFGQPLALLQKLERRFLTDYKSGQQYFFGLIFPPNSQLAQIAGVPRPEQANLLRWFEELRTEDKRSALSRIKVPTLIVQGDSDPIVTIESARYLNEKIPNSRLEIFTGTGHAPFLERPDQFNNCLTDFIKYNAVR